MAKEKKLSAGIQKFLEDQKREEEEKAKRDRQKKMELVARRDPKEQRKIDKTLKVIKSSRKYYSGDSTLDENTAVTLENEQPDEDDYGYTSTVSDQFHKKLMEKYQSLPVEKKFSSGSGKNKAMSKAEIQSTKDRVKNCFTSKDEEQHNFKQGQQKRTSKVNFNKGSGSLITTTDKKNGIKPKPKLKPAPIVDFQQLLKLAEQKQHEDITIEVPTKKEPERLLTMKEKRELEEMEAAKRAKVKPNRIPKLGTKVGDAAKHDNNNNENSARKLIAPSGNMQSKQNASINRTSQNNSEKMKRPAPVTQSSSSKLRDALQKSNGAPTKSLPSNHKVPSSSKVGTSTSSIKSRDVPTKSNSNPGQRPSAVNAKVEKYRPSTSTKEPLKTREFPPKDLKTREFPPKDVVRSREFPPKDVIRSREFPPKGLMRPRQFPPKDLMRSREFPPRDLKRKAPLITNKRESFVIKFCGEHFTIFYHFTGRIEDEESDYDSEMDDFIDDEDCGQDYSSEIKKIFGYDKSRYAHECLAVSFRDFRFLTFRYRDEDFDDSQMESDYRTVMREEFISKKLGLMEDLEDIKKEAEEKKMKEMRKKRKVC